MKISFTLADSSIPRTLYYERLCEAIKRNRRYVAAEKDADLLFPAEDVALETNWPRYGNPGSAFVRGQFDEAAYRGYLSRIVASPARICIVNMHPFARLPVMLAPRGNMVVADIALNAWERLLNPRTVSMPALPITTAPDAAAPGGAEPREKNILASFRGVPSHPCRKALGALHDGNSIICELIDMSNHAGRIDATTGAADSRYVDLLSRSVFAFVPRGDALFSYRLAEVLSFSCVPVILSDGWVLPFDRRIPWNQIALILPEQQVSAIPQILRQFPRERLTQMVAASREIFVKCLSSLDAVVESLLMEIEIAFFGKR